MFKKIWKSLQKTSRSYSDNLLKNTVKETLFKARMESIVTLDTAQRESRLILLVNILLLIFAIYFNRYAKLSKILALTIYFILLIRFLWNTTKIIYKLYTTRHIGFIHYVKLYWLYGGIIQHKKALKKTMQDLFTAEYSNRLGKPIIILHSGLSRLKFTQSQEEIFEYFYEQTITNIQKFFFSSVLLILVEILSYTLITFLIRQQLLLSY